jgi:hypothetical protein
MKQAHVEVEWVVKNVVFIGWLLKNCKSQREGCGEIPEAGRSSL